MALSYIAAVTTRVTLGTEVLVLPQRQPTLVAKQVSTLDTLSGGRVRLGVGVGWQESEYEALGEHFRTRGARMDEAIRLLRAYWSDAEVSFESAHYPTVAMAMEPKPPQGGAPADLDRRLLGGGLPARGPARRRLAGQPGHRRGRRAARPSRPSIATPRRPGAIPAPSGCRAWWRRRPATRRARRFYADHDAVVARVAALKAMGFGWVALNATAIFQAGARSVDGDDRRSSPRCTTASAPKSADPPSPRCSRRHT